MENAIDISKTQQIAIKKTMDAAAAASLIPAAKPPPRQPPEPEPEPEPEPALLGWRQRGKSGRSSSPPATGRCTGRGSRGCTPAAPGRGRPRRIPPGRWRNLPPFRPASSPTPRIASSASLPLQASPRAPPKFRGGGGDRRVGGWRRRARGRGGWCRRARRGRGPCWRRSRWPRSMAPTCRWWRCWRWPLWAAEGVGSRRLRAGPAWLCAPWSCGRRRRGEESSPLLISCVFDFGCSGCMVDMV